jgi:hypothetical protein
MAILTQYTAISSQNTAISCQRYVDHDIGFQKRSPICFTENLPKSTNIAIMSGRTGNLA